MLYKEGLSYTAVNTARSALSSLLSLPDGSTIGKHPLVSRLLKGIFQDRPPKPRYSSVWDVNCVPTHFQQMPSARELSLKELTLKLVMLLLLVTGQRGQTIHLLDLNNMSECNDSYIFTITEHLKQSRPGNPNPVITLRAYHNDKSLCVYAHLKEYLSRTRIIRGIESYLLISFVKPHRSEPRDH